MTTNDTQARRTLGQIAHEAGERAGRWERKWRHLSSAQKIEWEEIADVVAEHVRAAALASRQDQQGQAWQAPEGWKLVPVEPTSQMISAMSGSKACDDEGEFPALLDLIDYSGENKTHTVLKAAYVAMLDAAPSLPVGKEPTP